MALLNLQTMQYSMQYEWRVKVLLMVTFSDNVVDDIWVKVATVDNSQISPTRLTNAPRVEPRSGFEISLELKTGSTDFTVGFLTEL